jgi:hypothetical protein
MRVVWAIASPGLFACPVAPRHFLVPIRRLNALQKFIEIPLPARWGNHDAVAVD